MVLPLLAGGLGMYALSQRDKANQERAAAQQALNNAPTLGGDFLKAFITASPGLNVLTAPFRKEAQEARKDQSGFFPELGLSEGIRANLPSGKFIPAVAKGLFPIPAVAVGLGSEEAQAARQDQSGFWPEVGLSEAIGAAMPWHDYAKNKQQLQAVVDGGGGGFVNSFIGGAGKPMSGKEAWLAKTANSPAARSGAFTPDQRWQQQLKHRQWLADNNRL
tara:strand:+ start:136 stop:792 length:657 start_codon:yes stop_codon:yes gene_type:complete